MDGTFTVPNINCNKTITTNGSIKVGENDSSAMVLSAGKIGNKQGGQISFESDGWKRCYSWGTGNYNRGIAGSEFWTNGTVRAVTLTTTNIICSDTIKTKNITADWTTGAGNARFCKLHVDQLYGFAWEGTKTNLILMSDNLTFSTPQPEAPLMRFTMAHNGRPDDKKKQGLVIVEDAELRIHNRLGSATHFNHKTKPYSDAGYYGNWLRGNNTYSYS